MVVALPQSETLRFPTPTKPSALPSEILLLLFAKKSTAARLTYNRTTGEWASTDRAALRNLFEWFVKWPQTCELRGPFATSDAQGAKFDFTRFGPLSLEQLAPKLHLTLSF